jgi:hypothetical protein
MPRSTQGEIELGCDSLCLNPKDAEAQEPAVCVARPRDPLRDEIREVGRGLSLADTLTGRYVRLYSRRRL